MFQTTCERFVQHLDQNIANMSNLVMTNFRVDIKRYSVVAPLVDFVTPGTKCKTGKVQQIKLFL